MLPLLLAACAVDPDVVSDDDTGAVAQAITPAEALAKNRQRLFETYAHRIKENPDVCGIWQTLNASQKGAFLTITHRLQIATILNNGGTPEPLLDHLSLVYAIHGNEEKKFFELPCGGINANRVFFSMDGSAWSSLLYATVADPNNPSIADFGNVGLLPTRLRRWRATNDTPHRPFNNSTESNLGGPRAQTHFFTDQVARPLVNRGAHTSDILDGLALEVDQDYDFFHSSNTECANFRSRYAQNYGSQPGFPPVDYGWAPKCGGGGGGGGNTHPECDACAENACRLQGCFDADENGFACCSI